MKTALVIGAGPAGLMAANVLSERGHKVIVAEAKTSVARKFLMAGKSGLNLTKNEPEDRFLSHFGEAAPFLTPMLKAFGPQDVMDWAKSLGQPVFTGSTGRVFPEAMKASPILRAWLSELAKHHVEIKLSHRWVGIDPDYIFETPSGTARIAPDCTLLACGGASWARLGSDGAWADFLDVPKAPFQPANVGFVVDWSEHMQRHFGSPVKSVALKTADETVRGEFVISKSGIEGGGVYATSRLLREGHALTLDLMPDVSEEEIRKRLSKPRGKESLSNYLRKRLKLDPVKQALLMEFGQPLPHDLARRIKALHLPVLRSRPIDEAISTAGGIRLDALTNGLMLSAMPGVFAAGEMLDWEAPTGGYLLTACFATGRWAGHAAADWLER